MGRKNRIPTGTGAESGRRVKTKDAEPLSGDKQRPYFSFEYFDGNKECPSKWQPDELKALFRKLRMASEMTWMQVKSTGGRAGKSGLGYTLIQNYEPRPQFLGDDESISEIRITDTARVFGVKRQRAWYVWYLDRNHKTC